MRPFVYLFVAALTIWVLLMQRCNTPGYHGSFPENFNKLSRQEQVKWCANCHKDIYENERNGPHANAYIELEKHLAFVNSDKYQCGFYTKQVNNKFEKNCVRCHAPENLFQAAFSGHVDSSDALAARLLKSEPLPQSRPTSQGRITGIDCISCHYDGHRVVAYSDSKLDSIPCFPVSSKFSKSNMVCYPCHFEEVTSLQPQGASCINCHQEYKNGKSTHYYYWIHDSNGKSNPLLAGIAGDMRVVLANNGVAEISWQNKAIPHVIGLCTEMIVTCRVIDNDSNVLGERSIRLNRKVLFDKMNYEELGGNNHNGIAGDNIPAINAINKYPFTIKKPALASMYTLQIVQKAQYWFPDSLGQTTFTNVYKLNR